MNERVGIGWCHEYPSSVVARDSPGEGWRGDLEGESFGDSPPLFDLRELSCKDPRRGGGT